MNDVSRETKPETPAISAVDYDIDTAAVLGAMGINPASVRPGTARLSLIDNKLVLEYAVVRAVPPRIVGLAILAGVAPQEESDEHG